MSPGGETVSFLWSQADCSSLLLPEEWNCPQALTNQTYPWARKGSLWTKEKRDWIYNSNQLALSILFFPVLFALSLSAGKKCPLNSEISCTSFLCPVCPTLVHKKLLSLSSLFTGDRRRTGLFVDCTHCSFTIIIKTVVGGFCFPSLFGICVWRIQIWVHFIVDRRV